MKTFRFCNPRFYRSYKEHRMKLLADYKIPVNQQIGLTICKDTTYTITANRGSYLSAHTSLPILNSCHGNNSF